VGELEVGEEGEVLPEFSMGIEFSGVKGGYRLARWLGG
jgi:hypothetical protein